MVLRGHEREVDAVAISPNNCWVVTGSIDKTARLWLLQMSEEHMRCDTQRMNNDARAESASANPLRLWALTLVSLQVSAAI